MDAGLPDIGHIDQWHLGIPAGRLPPGDGGIAFTAGELAGGPLDTAPRIGLHAAMAAELPPAEAVRVQVPGYRGKSLIAVLSWLVTHRLAQPGAEVSWYLEKQQGPRSVAALLAELGWQDVRRARDGALIRISSRPPQPGSPPDLPPRAGPLPAGPHPAGPPRAGPSPAGPSQVGPPPAGLPAARQFSAVLGAHYLTFLADYGVFSPDHVDDGSRLLAEIMLRQQPVRALADIGVGYGPLAIAAVRNQVAERAVATDVDCLALWLAERNAAASGVQLEVRCTPDPLQVEATALTVCNVPTHVNAAQSAELMRALAQRAMGGRKLLIVVHASLETRYARHLAAAGLAMARHPGPSHVVLEATSRP
jgi:16S rRNA (guanine1207-N2)-methyltransferase